MDERQGWRARRTGEEPDRPAEQVAGERTAGAGARRLASHGRWGQAEAESQQGEGDGSWMRANKKDRAERAGSRVEEKDPSQKENRRQGDGAKPQRREEGAEAGELEVRRTRREGRHECRARPEGPADARGERGQRRAKVAKTGETAGKKSRPEGDKDKRLKGPGRVECMERDGGQTEGT